MVSIIVPIYNTEKYLQKCLRSIEEQTYKNIEVIMVNDGSKDNSEKIAASFIQRDARFILVNQNNQGVSAARNHGLDKAHGQYIIFVDSDDWLEANMIDVLVRNCQKTGADISCCQSDFQIRDDIEALERWDQERAIHEFLAHRKINGQLTNKLIKRNKTENIFFNTKIKYGEDALFFWNLLKVCNGMCITNQILYHITIHDDSASGGGFKPIRMQSHIVWKYICDDARKMKAKYCQMAKAQLGYTAFCSWLMMFISHCINKKYEEECRRIVKQNINYMISANFIKNKFKLCAIAFAYFPKITKYFLKKYDM